jgi:hypothetical protein
MIVGHRVHRARLVQMRCFFSRGAEWRREGLRAWASSGGDGMRVVA